MTDTTQVFAVNLSVEAIDYHPMHISKLIERVQT